MKISKKDWQNYIDRLRKVNEKAASKVAEYMRTHDCSTPEGVKELIAYAHAVATKYGEGAAELSCQMLDEVAEVSGKYITAAEPAKTATYAEIAKTIYGTMATTKDPDAIGAAVGRTVKLASVDTLQQNALRDGAEWAWIPSGDTCAFCLMLASRGWVKASKKAIKNGHAEHIHNNCDCTYCVRYDGETTVEGYDPDSLYEEWRSAGNTSRERLNGLRRKLYAENKDYINVQKRVAYARRQYSKLPDDEGIFITLDGRGSSKQYDIIKPRNLYKDLNKTEIGRNAARIVEEKGYTVKLLYGADNIDEYGNKLKGQIRHRDKEIWIYADITGSISETAAAFVHEANHLQDFGNCRKSEAYCDIKAALHKTRKDKLTSKEVKDIIKSVNKRYEELPWKES